MKITIHSSLLLVVIMLGIPSNSQSAEPPSKSPEQAVLDRRLGNWRDVYTLSKAPWTPEEKRGTAELTAKRILGGRFIQVVEEHSDKTSATAILTYDEQQKSYWAWWFSSEGYASEATGVWDADTNTMTWTSRSRGSPTTVTIRFLDADNYEWTVLVKDPAGKILYRKEVKTTRVKEPRN